MPEVHAVQLGESRGSRGRRVSLAFPARSRDARMRARTDAAIARGGRAHNNVCPDLIGGSRLENT